MTSYEDIRISLQHKREALQSRLGKIQLNLRTTPEPDSAEQALDRENDEVLERLDGSSRAELEMIDAALGRMDAGTYGICITCGETIAVERLTALPYATSCIKCAQ
jgi:RNA polymerase-binding protein DksA